MSSGAQTKLEIEPDRVPEERDIRNVFDFERDCFGGGGVGGRWRGDLGESEVEEVEDIEEGTRTSGQLWFRMESLEEGNGLRNCCCGG